MLLYKMFKSSLYFLKNINQSMFKKLNLYIEKDKIYYKKQIMQVISIFCKKNFLNIKTIKTNNFFKKNFFFNTYNIFFDLIIICFSLEILLLL